MSSRTLNIPHDYGAFIVVGDRESLLHGEGRQVILFVKLKEVCEMQKAELVLTMLSEKSRVNPDYKFNRLYRNLFNEDFYLRAYGKIYNKEGNLTEGTDGRTIDGFSIERIYKLIEELKTEKYKPKPVKKVNIPKTSGETRPIGIPSFDDKLVQEIVRQILEAIYEPNFNDNSHGYRPNRSPHTALYQIKKTCRGASWVIKGDIDNFFDNIDHEKLLDILKERIDDGRFINLIDKFLKAGYMEYKHKYETWSGTPQGGIISPILSNIYLDKLDSFLDYIILNNTLGDIRSDNKEYARLNGKRHYAKKTGNIEVAEEYLKAMRKMNRLDPMDENFRRVKYIRYADDFLVFVWSSKEVTIDIKDKIRDFLSSELRLNLNEEKALVTNLGDKNVRFLGYEISKSKDNNKLTNVNGVKKRTVNGTIQLLVPSDVITEKLKPFTKNGKSIHHNARINLPILDLINQYNSEIRGLYYYYNLATDVSTKIGKFRYYHYYSLAKTIARKEKSSVKKVIDKYAINVNLKQKTGTRKIIGVKYNTPEGEKVLTYFNESLSKQNSPSSYVKDTIYEVYENRCQLIDRLNANKCELCGYKGDTKEFEVHHIRKLKDIKQKYSKRGSNIPEWVLTMSRMNRKTLVLCIKCHKNLHNGNL
ncbi:MAG: group II intron reverse transcriptase/maturase [Tissierellaceae bacterium]|nr:group II intron reverse transcriptase/maturase [Tissierellaceae bacterium]